MAKFDDLTADQAQFLVDSVEAIQGRTYEQFWLLRTMDGSHLNLQLPEGDENVREDAPRSDAFYTGLSHLGYLDSMLGQDLTFRLTRRAVDYAAYARRSWLGQKWEDLCYDLGQGTTLRSRLLWSAFSIIVSVFLAYFREIITWLQAAP